MSENGRAQQIAVVVGTRPEAIKMAPVVRALRGFPEHFRVTLCVTGQHRELLDQSLDLFELEPEIDLGLMDVDQHPGAFAGRALAAIDRVLAEEVYDWLLVQGDTTTAMCGALAAFYRRIRIGHVEAGLRTRDLAAPFPEEMNRRVIDVVASALFAPTSLAVESLIAEGAPPESVFLTGNTVIDAARWVAGRSPEPRRRDLVLVTLHRRESFGAPLRRILSAIRTLADTFPAMRWVLPVHPNPAVSRPVRELLASISNVELVAPMDYRTFLSHLRAARVVLTDSGGVQEEAPAFGTPVVVLRDKTERPEGIAAGVALLVGTSPARIVDSVTELLRDPDAGQRMRDRGNPYGDGRAADRIAAILRGASWEPFRGGTVGA